jgi:hypothetical protein
MVEIETVPAQGDEDQVQVLSASQSAIARGLQQYYQFLAVGPTPKRLRMLLFELEQRTGVSLSS